ncbi:MAG: InlB B-repeat-containing protein [Sphaerochaetaceae bacterium]|nr:InlB B-repeat-containing protein [Sphaerochaetaceae bacterium]
MKKLLLVLLTVGLLFGLMVSCKQPEPEIHNVSFDLVGKGENFSITVVDGKPSMLPLEPTYEGYDFNGWYTEPEYQNLWSVESLGSVKSDFTVYAKWDVRSCTITFNLNGHGSAIGPVTENYGSVVAVPTAPGETGYTFGGWFSDAACTEGNEWIGEASLTTDKTVYAKWTAEKRTVSFELNGHGSAVSPITADYGSAVTVPTAPSETGYTFGGWFTDADCTEGNEWTGESALAADKTVYAKWTIASYTVTFDLNGHGIAIIPVTANYGSVVALPTTPTETGYTFGGWYTNSECTEGNEWTGEASLSASKTVYAKWTINEYTITFDLLGHGSAISPVSANYGNPVGLPTPPTETGYTFGGWYKDTNFNLVDAWNGEDAISASRTVYAKWTINSYTITFDLNGHGSKAISPITKNYLSSVSVPTEPYDFTYAFLGWYTDAECTEGNEWTGEASLTASRTVYAKWALKDRTVTFDMKGHGTQVESISVPHGSKLTAPEAPTEVGYTFRGWSKVSAYDSFWEFDTEVVTSSLTLYASWTINRYTVTFNMKGHGSLISPVSKNYGSTVELPTAPTATGYTFGGWFTDADCTEGNEWTGEAFLAANKTVYAKWSPVLYTVTFNMEGHGTQIDAVQVPYGESVSPLPRPTETGYTFRGWFPTENFVAGYGGWGSTSTVRGDTTLYAWWEVNHYKVTFNMHGHGTAIATINADYGSKLDPIADPSDADYLFDGWYLDSDYTQPWVWSFEDDTVVGNMTIHAKWDIPTIVNETELKAAFTNGGVYLLNADITMTEPMEDGSWLVLASDKVLSLDLNGHILDANYQARVIKTYGELSIYDGDPEATHDSETLPSGGLIANGQTTGEGGGVSLLLGSFGIYSGTIYNCSASNGGGVSTVYRKDGNGNSTKNYLYLRGGAIIDCTATGNGGGVYYNGSSFFDVAVYKSGNQFRVENCRAANGGGLYLYDVSSGVRCGLVVTDCRATNGNGGGIYYEYCSMQIEDSVISGCSATGNGGGVYVIRCNYTLTKGIYDSEITDCHAAKGGAIAVESNVKEFTMNGNRISDCTATTDGGGIYITGGSAHTIRGTSITNCTATAGGGFYNSSSGSTLRDGEISDCSTTGNGGAIWNSNTLTLNNMDILRCSASGGGAIYHRNASNTLTITNGTLISECTAETGGAIYQNAANTINMVDSSITGCSSTGNGGGVYSVANATFNMSGTSSITATSAARYGGAVLMKGTMSMSDQASITGNSCGNYGGAIQVDNGATLTVSGQANVSGNLKTGSTDEVNVRINTAANRIQVASELSGEASIGVTLEAGISADAVIAEHATALPAGTEGYFHYDGVVETNTDGKNHFTSGDVDYVIDAEGRQVKIKVDSGS